MSRCKLCGNCCKYMLVYMEDIDWDVQYVGIRGGMVDGEYGLLPFRCPMLDEGNRCTIYESRPMYCRRFPMERHNNFLGVIGCRFYEEDKNDQ